MNGIPVLKDPKKLIIHWTRHAESCSNYDSHNFLDKDLYQDRPVGFEKLAEAPSSSRQASSRSTNIYTGIKASFKYHPNLSFVGMQQAILLGENFARHQQYDVIFCSATLRSVMTCLMALRGTNAIIYVVPYINEILNVASIAMMDYQNTPFSSTILKRQVLFIKDWLEENWIKHFDDIEIMQQLISLGILLSANSKYPDIVESINSLLNCKISKGVLEYGAVSMDKYRTCFNNYTLSLIEDIRVKLVNDDQSNIKGYVLYFDKVLDKSFLRGPKIDFSVLEFFEKRCQTKNDNKYFIHQDLRYPDMLKFYQYVVPYAIHHSIFPVQQEITIMCVSHGAFVKDFFSKRYNHKFDHMMNTQIWAEEIVITKLDNIISIERLNFNVNVYVPPKIRTNFQNFEVLNMDICRLESLKGILNYPLVDPSLTNKMIPTKMLTTNQNIADIVSPDVKFYFDKQERYWPELAHQKTNVATIVR